MKIPEILLVETFHQPGSLASVLAVIADERLNTSVRDSGGTHGGDRTRVNRAFIIAF